MAEVRLRLELRTFEPDARWLERWQHSDIGFTTLEALGDGVAVRQRLFGLVREAVLDDPGFEGEFESEQEFEERIWPLYWARRTGLFVALRGDVWLGLTSVHVDAAGVWHQGTTGVARPERGRGLAMALKTLALEHAKQCGAASVHTRNDRQNVAMRRVNERLGFVELS